MKKKFVDSITNLITKHKECDELKIKTIRYGLEGIYSLITKLIVVTIITIIIGTFAEFITLLFAYSLLRTYSFGLHYSKNWMCWLFTLIIYVGGSLFIKCCNFNIYITFIIWILAFISFLLWAPADTPKRPLIREKQRKTQKFITCTISIIYLFIILFLNNNIVTESIFLALIIQTIMINPLTYFITKTTFNNYKNYQKMV